MIRPGERFGKTESYESGACVNLITNKSWPNWLSDTVKNGYWHLSGSTMQTDVYNVSYTLISRSKVSSGRGRPPRCQPINYYNRSFTIAVINEDPIIHSNPPSTIGEGQNKTYAINATDANNDPLSYSITNAPPFISINGKKVIFNPNHDDIGYYRDILITVKDSYGGKDKQSFDLKVTNMDRRPRFESKPPKNIRERERYEYSINAIDPDGSMVSLSLVKAPDFLILDGNLLSGTPGWDDSGSYHIEIKAVSNGESRIQSYNLHVEDRNRKPRVTSTPDKSVKVGSLYKYEVKARDPDGDKVSLSATLQNGKSLPEWLSFDSNGNTGVLYGTPKPSDVGRLNIVIKAKDNGKPPRVRKQRFPLTISHKSVSGIQVYFVYPTSCRNKCTIKFAVPSKQYVYLEVYSAAGELMRTTQKEMYQEGINKLMFKPRMLPTGRYYFVLHGKGISYRASISIVN